MQHQKAKHFKCNLCPRRLNTAGGLAVHIQQVHKLEPENLPRIDNALPGRDGYEVEIFGMEGIPAPDVADYKRRKEIELGLNPGSISQPPAKRPKVENRAISEDELKAQLEAHKALMGASDPSNLPASSDASTGGVYGAPPQAYSAPPTVVSPPTVGTPTIPPGAPHFFPPPGYPGAPPFPMPPGMQMPMPPGFPPLPPMQGPPPGLMMPPPGLHPFSLPPGMAPPPFPFFPPGMSPPGFPPMATPTPPVHTPNFVPASNPHAGAPPPSVHSQTGTPTSNTAPPELRLPNPALSQTNTPFKKATELKWSDANFSPEEHRAIHPKYLAPKDITNQSQGANSAQSGGEEFRGKKRARAEDFL
ncbi:hypothetical protein PHLCEN_2v7913 [Hermanssonia centrifuga]|uniref:C2H2-type domain-containing protein n=1 Tax=Hermanssonia centrifuga TaxID=98765 RepID=A0A2R6NVD4_9APHY|nr:hypothetical protein PHLCEN_2v7913 [Hermanssonia centrifuga]